MRAGDTVVIAPGVPHKLWNPGEERARAPVLLRAAVLARRHRPARGLMRALAVLAAAAVLAGCGSERGAITAGGPRGRRQPDRLHVGARAGARRRARHGRRLEARRSPRPAATSATSGSTSSPIDEGSLGAPDPPRVPAAAAEQVIRDAQVIAVVGAVRSDAALTSLPLFNAAGILLVSPGAGYPGFTEPVAAGEPERWFPSGRADVRARDRGRHRAGATRCCAPPARGRVAIEAEAGKVAAEQVEALQRGGAATGSSRTCGAPTP